MKKMTLNEFKKGLKLGDFDLNSYGWEGILNALVLLCFKDAEENRRKEHEALAKDLERRALAMHDYLKDRGYYGVDANAATVK